MLSFSQDYSLYFFFIFFSFMGLGFLDLWALGGFIEVQCLVDQFWAHGVVLDLLDFLGLMGLFK